MNDFQEIKNEIFEKRSDVKEEYNKMRPLRKFQKELIKARIERGLSQTQLAKKVGTTQSVISRLENEDDYNPNLKTIVKISKALDKKIDISLI